MLKELILKLKYKTFLRKNLNLNQKLKISEDYSFEKISLINWEKRKQIVLYAYKNIPFYKDFYDRANFDPTKLINEFDWEKIPIIDKNILKQNSELLVNPKISKKHFKLSTTGGSTGVPLKVYFDNRIPLDVFSWRVYRWWNVYPWENQAFIFRDIHFGIRKFLNKIIWWPTNRIFLDAAKMTNDSMNKFINSFNKIKPSLLQGYVGGVYEVARYVEKNNIDIHSPKAIWVTSAPLTENQRDYIQRIFKAPVFDQYGCGEIFWLAAECSKQEGLHVFYDYRHIEFLDETNKIIYNGEIGDALITDLENKVFPLIRYKNGDRGRYLRKDCSCGIKLPIIDKIKGRTTDNIYTPTGICVEGSFLTTIFDDFPDLVNGFQLIQNKDFSIDIICVLNKFEAKDNPSFSLIKNKLLKILNNELIINFIFVDKLNLDRGKVKYIISLLDEPRY